MSQDLFAAFAQPTDEVRSHANGNVSFGSDQGLPWQTATIVMAHQDDDEFGDFEDASTISAPRATEKDRPKDSETYPGRPTGPDTSFVKMSEPFQRKQTPTSGVAVSVNNKSAPQPTTGRHPFADHMDLLFAADEDEYDAGQDEWNDLSNNPEAAMAYSKRVIQEQLDAESRKSAPSGATSHTQSTLTNIVGGKAKNPNVLFDVDDVSDEEDTDAHNDWGNFEGDDAVSTSISHARPGSITERFDLLGLAVAAPIVKTSPTKTDAARAVHSRQITGSRQFTVQVPDDPWDDFEPQNKSAINAFRSKHDVIKSSVETPPTNIPPPSVLLSNLSALLKVNPSRENIEAILQDSWVLAHVLAGRKLRWKRSTVLAASMRIGPAAAGGKSGMKLAGVDRAEMAKEDREVAEVLFVWRAQVGRFRTVVAAYALAKNSPGTVKKLPDVNETLTVRTIKAIDGGFVAPHECALCGLRREERISRLDENVEDSFGEWWMESASMHTICARWWLKSETALRSR